MLQDRPAAKILAGGTDLLVNMKHRVEMPPVLVNIKSISDLDYIHRDNGAVRIGALTPLKRISRAPFIAEKLPALARAASLVGSFHHQTMGTIAGNLCQQNRCKYYNQSQWWRSARPTCYKAGGEICHVVNKKETCYSSYCGDSAPALLVMNARVVLQGGGAHVRFRWRSYFPGMENHRSISARERFSAKLLYRRKRRMGCQTTPNMRTVKASIFPLWGQHSGHQGRKRSIGLLSRRWLKTLSEADGLKPFWTART